MTANSANREEQSSCTINESGIQIDLSSWDTTSVVPKWLAELPDDLGGFVSAGLPPVMDAELYKDYLNWSKSTIEKVEKDLEECEQEYRRLGLSYHLLRFDVRKEHTDGSSAGREFPVHDHSGNLILAAKGIAPLLNPDPRGSLEYAFNFAGPRENTVFFREWRGVSYYLEDAKRLAKTKDGPVAMLRYVCDQLAFDCDSMTAMMKRIRKQLRDVDRNIQKVSDITIEGCPKWLVDLRSDLGDLLTLEGVVFRCWATTFPEVVSGQVSLDSAEQVLKFFGPEASMNLKNAGVVKKAEDEEDIEDQDPWLMYMF